MGKTSSKLKYGYKCRLWVRLNGRYPPCCTHTKWPAKTNEISQRSDRKNSEKDMIAAKRGGKIRNVLLSYLQSNILSRGPHHLDGTSLQFFENLKQGAFKVSLIDQ